MPFRVPRRVALIVAPGLAAIALSAPSTVLAHTLSNTYQSRLPLIVYLAGAAIAVALSFAFLLIADVRAEPPVVGSGKFRRHGSAPCSGRSA